MNCKDECTGSSPSSAVEKKTSLIFIQTYLLFILILLLHIFHSKVKVVKLQTFTLLLIHAAYNAIWNSEDNSVTRFLQCKGCLSQSPSLSAPVIAAEVHYPRDMAQDLVSFMHVNKNDKIYMSSIWIMYSVLSTKAFKAIYFRL